MFTMSAAVLLALGCAAMAFGQNGAGMGRGMGRGFMRHGGGPPGDAAHAADRETFHYLLDARDEISRTVTRLPDGVETVTESDDPQVAAAIQRHVRAMHERLLENRPIHRRDPLFAELFDHAAAIDMRIEPTARGLRVRETSRDAWVVALIQAHADVVSAFLRNGYDEVRRNHALPPRPHGRSP